MKFIRIIFGIIFCLSIYLLPFGISLLRNRENKVMLFFINALGGLIIIGWVVAFFMSLKARDNAKYKV